MKAGSDSEQIDIFLKMLIAGGPASYKAFREILIGFGEKFEDVVDTLDHTETKSGSISKRIYYVFILQYSQTSITRTY